MRTLGLLITGFFIILMGLFIASMLFNIFQYEIVGRLADAITGSDLTNQMSAAAVSNISGLKAYFLSFDMFFDLIGLALIVFLFTMLIRMALDIPKLSRRQFVGALFLTSIVNAIVIYFVSDILIWLKDELFVTFLGANYIITFWFVDNSAFIFFATSLILLLTNQMKDQFIFGGLRE